MKFLCLPGRYSNAKTMKAQLGPLLDLLESDNISFCFTQGPFFCEAAPGFADYFGTAPFCRWYAVPLSAEEERHALLDQYHGDGSEALGKKLLQEALAGITPANFRLAFDTVQGAMDAEGDVEGLIGFSEGASMAATFVLEEQRRRREENYQPQIKCVILFNGTPPAQLRDGKSELVVEPDTLIPVPSLHVFGATDPFVVPNMDLYGVFDPQKAELFDHGSGHLIPREIDTLQALREAILRTISDM